MMIRPIGISDSHNDNKKNGRETILLDNCSSRVRKHGQNKGEAQIQLEIAVGDLLRISLFYYYNAESRTRQR